VERIFLMSDGLELGTILTRTHRESPARTVFLHI
jgi:hypothetical protein